MPRGSMAKRSPLKRGKRLWSKAADVPLARDRLERAHRLQDRPARSSALAGRPFREHRDGWGIAVFDENGGGWQIEKGIACAGEDERFHRLAVGSHGEVLVSHVRQKTVGETSLANTHPFERGRWVFAHNGTVKDVAWLRAQTSLERLAEVRGETDSELLFAWLLTCLDMAGVANAPRLARTTDRAIGAAVRAARGPSGVRRLQLPPQQRA